MRNDSGGRLCTVLSPTGDWIAVQIEGGNVVITMQTHGVEYIDLHLVSEKRSYIVDLEDHLDHPYVQDRGDYIRVIFKSQTGKAIYKHTTKIDFASKIKDCKRKLVKRKKHNFFV